MLDRFTLAAITAAAVLAAFLAATMIPATPATPNPLLTWAVVYLGSVLGLARAVHMPPARTLCAATLLVIEVLALVLAGLRYSIDGMLRGLAEIRQAGTATLAAKGA